MKPLPSRKIKGECFLALDMGTEAVKALVFEKKVRGYFVTGSVLRYFGESEAFGKSKFISNVKEEAVKISGKTPKGLIAGLPADILKTRVNFQNIERENKEKIIDKKEEEDIRRQIFEKAKKEISEQFAKDYGIMPQDIQFINQQILEIKIDGYEVPVLAGYAGRKLEFRVLASFLPKDYFDNSKKIAEILELKIEKMINPIVSVAKIFGIIGGVFIDIGGEITQVCVVRSGKIEMVDEFAVGGKDFSSAISETLGIRQSEARLLKERYSQGDLTQGAAGKIEEILVQPCREWQNKLKSKIKDVKGLLPQSFYLFGGGSQLRGMEDLVSGEERRVKFIYPKDFEDVVDNTRCLNSPQFINPIALFYEKENF